MKKVLIVVPAFNEADSIKSVVADLRQHGYRNIVVIDDGSSDGTGKIAAGAKVPVLRHVFNRGLGAALGTGFEYARRTGAEIVVTFDSDGQHRAADIKRLILPIVQGRADVVTGSRLQGQSHTMPASRKLLNHLSNLSTFLLYWVWSTDTLSGLRAFNKKALHAIRIKSDRMEVSNEFFKEIRINHLRYREIPIAAIYTKYSAKSSSQGDLITASLKLAFRMILRFFS